MTCEDISTRLTDYLLGDLSEGDAADVRLHLDTCAECRALAEDLEPTLELLQDALAAPTSARTTLTGAQHARILRADRRGRRVLAAVFERHQVLSALAAVLVIGFVFAGLLATSFSGVRGKSPVVECVVAEALDEIEDMAVQPGAYKKAAYSSARPTSSAGIVDGDGLDAGIEAPEPIDVDFTTLPIPPVEPTSPSPLEGEGWGGGQLRSEGKRLRERQHSSSRPAALSFGVPDRQLRKYGGDLSSPADRRRTRSTSGRELDREISAGSVSAPGEPVLGDVPLTGRLFNNQAEAGRAGSGEDKTYTHDQRRDFDAVAMVKSPVLMKGINGSRNGGRRAEANRRSGWESGSAVDESVVISGAEVDVEKPRRPGKSPAAPKSEIVTRMYSALPSVEEKIPSLEASSFADFSGSGPGGVASRPSSRGLTKSESDRDQFRSLGLGEGDDDGDGFALGEELAQGGRGAVKLDGKKKAEVRDKANGAVDTANRVEGLKVQLGLPDPNSSPPLSKEKQLAEGEKREEVLRNNEDLIEIEIEELEDAADDELVEDDNGKSAQPGRFKAQGVNPFVNAVDNAFSTFSIDVDTASYTLARNYLLSGRLPPAESVRTEEFVNFFDYDLAPPLKDTFAVHVQVAPSPFGHGLHLMNIGVKGRRVGREEQRGAVLTFVIDSSGSMNSPDRIGLVKQALRMLVSQLGPHDRVAIIQYASHARLVLDSTPAAEAKQILSVIDSLQCGGSTNLEEAMRRAYELAARTFVPGAENRVLLLSDGVANLGAGVADEILDKVAVYREQGIRCSVYGFGLGTYDDVILETLANKGDGTYAFIDSDEEARRVFVEELGATLNTIASDVKIQVEFNPRRVTRYRQLGYENRQLKKEDFRNDAVDAGEVGSGQSVTALYELALRTDHAAQRSTWRTVSADDVLATVRVRYRRTDTGKVEEVEHVVRLSDMSNSFRRTSPQFQLAACVAEFAEILRGSPFATGREPREVAAKLRPVSLKLGLDTRVQELQRLMEGAGSMSRGE